MKSIVALSAVIIGVMTPFQGEARAQPCPEHIELTTEQEDILLGLGVDIDAIGRRIFGAGGDLIIEYDDIVTSVREILGVDSAETLEFLLWNNLHATICQLVISDSNYTGADQARMVVELLIAYRHDSPRQSAESGGIDQERVVSRPFVPPESSLGVFVDQPEMPMEIGIVEIGIRPVGHLIMPDSVFYDPVRMDAEGQRLVLFMLPTCIQLLPDNGDDILIRDLPTSEDPTDGKVGYERTENGQWIAFVANGRPDPGQGGEFRFRDERIVPALVTCRLAS